MERRERTDTRRVQLAVVVADGAADRTYADLDHRSPLEYASTPALDALAARGRGGLVRTMYEGLSVGSLVGFLGLFGLDPRAHPAVERSALEAKRLALPIGPRDLVFRCNIVELGSDGRLADFTAGQIDERLACSYLGELGDLGPFELHHDYSYRNLLLYRDCPLDRAELTLFEPHSNLGRYVDELLPRQNGGMCAELVDLMRSSKRGPRMLWPWGPSADLKLPRLGYELAVVTALSFLSGLATAVGGRAVIPAGATGYGNTDLSAKLRAFDELFPDSDVVFVHCNAPDEESHVGNLHGKVETLEAIDREITGPIIDRITDQVRPARVVFCTDHYTYCDSRMHGEDPVPFVVAGFDVAQDPQLTTYSERAIAATAGTPIESFELVESLRSLG